MTGDRLDSWIQLFNAESEEELDMLAAKYEGLAEAVEIMKRMSLGKMLRYQYESHLKAVRDRYGEDEYVRNQGRAEGRAEGNYRHLVTQVCKKMKLGQDMEKIAEDLVEEISVVEPIYRAAIKFAPEYEPEAVLKKMAAEGKGKGQ